MPYQLPEEFTRLAAKDRTVFIRAYPVKSTISKHGWGTLVCRFYSSIRWSRSEKDLLLILWAVDFAMRVTTGSFVLLVVLILSAVSFSQLPSSRCDSTRRALEECSFLTQIEPPPDRLFALKLGSLDRAAMLAESSEGTTDGKPASEEATHTPVLPKKEGFHWGR